MREPKDIEIDGKRLDIILKEHIHWLHKDIDGWKSMRANLSGADLHHACLYGANLRGGILYGANLCGAYLHNANLYCANLQGVNLHSTILYDAKMNVADLSGADLTNADLSNADLHGACLHRAKLYGTNLYGANLYDAKLWNADLKGVDLSKANLCGAHLYGANLCNADLDGANLYDTNLDSTNGDLIQYRKGKILTESIIGYKKCKDNIIVTLEIPRGAIVFSINGDKCRTNKAKVIAIDGADKAYSLNNKISYYIGDEFTIYNFDCEYNRECASGIHFFMTKEKAIEYKY